MAKTLQQAVVDVTWNIQQFMRVLGGHRPRTFFEVWEQKMDPLLFEERGFARRANRRRRHDVALLRVLAGVLQIFFYIFLLLGLVVAIGLMFTFPIIGAFFLVCAIAAFIEVYRRLQKQRGMR
jgi:hypothetical protein